MNVFTFDDHSLRVLVDLLSRASNGSDTYPLYRDILRQANNQPVAEAATVAETQSPNITDAAVEAATFTPEQEAEYAKIFACRRSEQISEEQWAKHCQDEDFILWLQRYAAHSTRPR